MPGAKLGLSHEDPTIAELLKNHGYATAQFGKNHLGDRNEYLPTVHGFDEYSGVLYHLNALEEPENLDYPKNPEFLKKFGPRNNLYTWATDKFDKTEDPRWGVVGKQRIKDDGALTKKRMETYDEETLQYSLKFIDKAVKDDKPFFVWHNATRMHVFTHLSKKYQDMVPEKGLYGAGMTEFDDDIGVLLKQLDDLGIADNTIVIISTDNGAEVFTWPDGGTTPFRGEKATTWEGGFRVPAVVRWPGVIKPGTVINDIFSHLDWMPTIMAAVGEPDIKEKLLKGTRRPARSSRYIWTDTTRPLCSREKDQVRARRSSTSPTTATCQRSGMTSGRCSSPSRSRRAWMSGGSPCLRRACPYLLTFMRIRLKRPCRVATVTNMTSGPPSGCLCSSPLRPSWRSSLEPSRSIRQGKSRPASASVTPSHNCKQPRRADESLIQPDGWALQKGRPPMLFAA